MTALLQRGAGPGFAGAGIFPALAHLETVFLATPQREATSVMVSSFSSISYPPGANGVRFAHRSQAHKEFLRNLGPVCPTRALSLALMMWWEIYGARQQANSAEGVAYPSGRMHIQR